MVESLVDFLRRSSRGDFGEVGTASSRGGPGSDAVSNGSGELGDALLQLSLP